MNRSAHCSVVSADRGTFHSGHFTGTWLNASERWNVLFFFLFCWAFQYAIESKHDMILESQMCLANRKTEKRLSNEYCKCCTYSHAFRIARCISKMQISNRTNSIERDVIDNVKIVWQTSESWKGKTNVLIEEQLRIAVVVW